MRKLLILLSVVVIISSALTDDSDNENTLKCIVKFLQGKGVNEDFFSSIDTSRLSPQINCEQLMNAKLTKAYTKIEDKLNADAYFSKLSKCILKEIRTDANNVIVLQREAIKIHGLGIKVWNYFDQRKHLDDLKRSLEHDINVAANGKCAP